MKNRYLTKSRFKTGVECATKLYFTGDVEYGNTMSEDSFLQALAAGGFQVGELAKIYYPMGVEVTAKDHDESVKQTQELMLRDQVVIFEAAIRHGDLFARVDILVKDGDTVELIEVKAKSIHPVDDAEFFTKKGEVNSTWKPYVLDVAFQTYVMNRAYPKLKTLPYLMLADKSSVASVDGLNQRFLIAMEGGRTSVRVKAGTTLASVGGPVLAKIDVRAPVQAIWNSDFGGLNFDQLLGSLAERYKTKSWSTPQVGKDCKGCEFRIGEEAKAEGLKSGFDKCWSDALGYTAEQLASDFSFDINGIRQKQIFDEGKFLMSQLVEEDLAPKSDGEGLSLSERQWLQVQQSQRKDGSVYFDQVGLGREMATWRYPLNMIDFETMTVAVPFHEGRRPYEQVAFQFSHHVIEKDGRVRHANQFINVKRGHFPNFDFVRALKVALEANDGTIFRYSAHENTVLRQIYAQLEPSSESDRYELMAFIDQITQHGEGKKRVYGPRNMVDLWEMVKLYFMHPKMGGSNSIKYVLPAILEWSPFLQKKYGAADYGSSAMPSLNFKDWCWLEFDAAGLPKDPYSYLGELFEDVTFEKMNSFFGEEAVADGAAAMTAYARMQFSEMSDAEYMRLEKALLRYCELDTLAMVMLVEGWRNAN